MKTKLIFCICLFFTNLTYLSVQNPDYEPQRKLLVGIWEVEKDSYLGIQDGGKIQAKEGSQIKDLGN